jgi:hypothetical protein
MLSVRKSFPLRFRLQGVRAAVSKGPQGKLKAEIDPIFKMLMGFMGGTTN